MWTYPQIDPVALQLGPLALRWYGLTYLLAFIAAWALARRRSTSIGQTHAWVDDLIFYGALGVVLGGRLGYVFFYQLDRFLADPTYLFLIWEGGMSFHGGLLGVIVALAWLARRSRTKFHLLQPCQPDNCQVVSSREVSGGRVFADERCAGFRCSRKHHRPVGHSLR